MVSHILTITSRTRFKKTNWPLATRSARPNWNFQTRPILLSKKKMELQYGSVYAYR
jgi:hypothetical protein